MAEQYAQEHPRHNGKEWEHHACGEDPARGFVRVGGRLAHTCLEGMVDGEGVVHVGGAGGVSWWVGVVVRSCRGGLWRLCLPGRGYCGVLSAMRACLGDGDTICLSCLVVESGMLMLL